MAAASLFLACAFACWQLGLSADCPTGWQLIGKHCFWLSSSDHTFESCQRDVCGPRGATLACVRKDEATWLAWRLGIGLSQDVMAVWIGYSAGSDRKWSWVNACDNTWEHWMPNEPNDYCGGEDCAAITGAGGRWMDASCRLRLPCLCEFPGVATAAYNLSVPALRDDTCYADCGDLTRWCSAWPFLRLYDVKDDVCHWEETDGEKRGRGTSECAARVKKVDDCGDLFSYSVGRCRCSPKKGEHSTCSHREPDVTSDIFRLAPGGAELLHARQRCVYSLPVDHDYFVTLMPATTWRAWFRIWLRAASIWVACGAPCAAVMLLVCCRMCCGRRGQDVAAEDGGEQGGAGGEEASYGPLLDVEGDTTAADEVNRWIFRAALGAVLYGVSLLVLGGTLAAHMAGSSSGFVIELMASLFMSVSMTAVARAAFMVDRRLSSIARDVAGRWVLVAAGANFGMALTALCTVLVFSTLADRDYENICFATYVFRWSMLVTLPLQCLGGVAIWRVRARAERYAGSRARVDGWVDRMVVGSFLAGASVWWAGYLDCVHEAFIGVAIFFVCAALGQLASGLSLLKANRKVKEYFRQDAQVRAADVTPTAIGRPGLQEAGSPQVTMYNGSEMSGYIDPKDPQAT